jgi:hypothetical protein
MKLAPMFARVEFGLTRFTMWLRTLTLLKWMILFGRGRAKIGEPTDLLYIELLEAQIYVLNLEIKHLRKKLRG